MVHAVYPPWACRRARAIHIMPAICANTSVLAINRSLHRALATVNAHSRSTDTRRKSRPYVRVIRIRCGKGSIVRAMPVFPVQGTVRVMLTRHANVTTGVLLTNLRTNISPAKPAKNVRNIGTVLSAISDATPTANTSLMSLRTGARQ